MFTKIKTALARRWLAAELKSRDDAVTALKEQVREAKVSAEMREEALKKILSQLADIFDANGVLSNEVVKLREEAAELQENLNLAVDRLEKITELLPNKATANGTAKKMARIAREAVAMIMGDK